MRACYLSNRSKRKSRILPVLSNAPETCPSALRVPNAILPVHEQISRDGKQRQVRHHPGAIA
jgi:hypothetical protein